MALYISTLYPAFPVDDSPETVSSAVNLGVQHAPGYPLDTLTGKLAQVLPLGGPYFRVNLVSAAAGAASASAVALLTARLFPVPAGIMAGALAGLMLAGTDVFWDCSLSGKGGIYQLNLLLTLLALLSFMAGQPMAGALFTGLGMANHWMSSVAWLPVFLLMGWPWNTRRLLMGAMAGALGCTLYIQLPFCAAHEPVWGDPATLGGLVDIIMRRGFGQHATIGKSASMPFLQAGDALLRPLRESGLPFTILALAGLPILWRPRRREFIAPLLGAVLTIGAVSVAANPVHISTGELYLWLTDRFYLPFLAVTALGAGAGLLLVRSAMPKRWRPGVWILGGLIAASMAGSRFQKLDHSRDYIGFDYAHNLLAGISGPAIILGEADYQTFPLHSILRVEEIRPDVGMVITNPFLNRKWGWKRLSARYPEAATANVRNRAWRDKVVAFTDLAGSRAGLYHLSMCSYPALQARLDFHGIVYSIGKKPPPALRTPSAVEVEGYFHRYRMRGMYSDFPFKDPTAFSVLDIYTLALSSSAMAPLRNRDNAGAIAAYRRALQLPGRMGRAMILGAVGKIRAGQSQYGEAEDAFREAARLKPRDLDMWTNLATACAAQGKDAEALRLFREILRRNPGHPAARANLRLLKNLIYR